jgi:hypothetical protein
MSILTMKTEIILQEFLSMIFKKIRQRTHNYRLGRLRILWYIHIYVSHQVFVKPKMVELNFQPSQSGITLVTVKNEKKFNSDINFLLIFILFYGLKTTKHYSSL